MPTPTSTTFKQGDTYFNPNTGKPDGTVQFDAQTGKPLARGATTTQQNQLIVTGTKPASQFAKNTQELTRALNSATPTVPQTPNQPQPQVQPDGSKIESPYSGMGSYSDPYTQMLDKISATSDKATQNLISTIKATKASREGNVNQEYDRLKQGLMSLGLSTGNINFTPDLVYGSIQQAENARMSKLQELDREEATTLLEAQQAVEDKDFRLLKERMDYYKSIKKSRLDVLKESYDTMATEAKIGELQAFQIYDQLQKLPEKSKTAFLQEIATRFNIPLLSLTSQVAEITRDRAKKATGSGGFSKAEIASGAQDLEENKGADGYVDPYFYQDAYKKWVARGGTAKTFIANYPPKLYVNPDATNLPPYLMPAKTKSNTSDNTFVPVGV